MDGGSRPNDSSLSRNDRDKDRPLSWRLTSFSPLTTTLFRLSPDPRTVSAPLTKSKRCVAQLLGCRARLPLCYRCRTGAIEADLKEKHHAPLNADETEAAQYDQQLVGVQCKPA